jgi:hypothetical protein
MLMAWQKTSENASCNCLLQMHVTAPWLAISVAWTERHVDARQQISWMERKDKLERIISSETCSMIGILVLVERIFSSRTCSMIGITFPLLHTGMLATSLLSGITVPLLHTGMLATSLLIVEGLAKLDVCCL